jgi:hypothetical protein
MFRLREEILRNTKVSGQVEKSATFSNQIAYKLGAKIKVNEQVTMGFEIGNDWYATEEYKGIPGNYYTKRNPMTPWFDLAYAQWDPGYLHITAGIIPVKGTALMDLLGASLLFDRSYQRAAHIPWGVVTNFSQTGLRIGAPIVKGPVSLGVDVMTAVIEQRPSATGIDETEMNHSAVEFLLEAPLSVGGLSATPQVFCIPNRTYNTATEESDMEFGAGIDLGYKLSDAVSLRGGFGYAHNSNENAYVAGDSVLKDPFDAGKGKKPGRPFDARGVNITLGTSIKAGPGKFDLDFNLSTDANAEDSTVNAVYPFGDLKYGWALNKNFIVMPRLRFFVGLPSASPTYATKLTTRPELIFVGSF